MKMLGGGAGGWQGGQASLPRKITLPQLTPPHRQDVQGRLTYFEVRVGNTSSATDPSANPQCAWYTTPAQATYIVKCTTPLVGRYVSVRLPPGYTRLAVDGSAAYLTLCEVQVAGAPM